MANKKMTIKGITFPNFGDDNSKKNFRLVFHIGYTDPNGEDFVAVFAKPTTGHWQWRKKDKDAFLTPTVVGNSVTLNMVTLKLGDGKKIAPKSDKIGEVDGEITDVSVQFLDVEDISIGGTFITKVLPELINLWQSTGLDPLDFVPIAGGFKAIINKKVDIKTFLEKSKNALSGQVGDKILHTIGVEYHGESPLVLTENNVEWGDNGKTGTYEVTLGII